MHAINFTTNPATLENFIKANQAREGNVSINQPRGPVLFNHDNGIKVCPHCGAIRRRSRQELCGCDFH